MTLQEPVNLSYHPAKFGGHRHCGCEYIMIFACHVILQYHVINGSCVFIGIRVDYHPDKFGGHRHCGNEDIFWFVT